MDTDLKNMLPSACKPPVKSDGMDESGLEQIPGWSNKNLVKAEDVEGPVRVAMRRGGLHRGADVPFRVRRGSR